MGKCNDEIYQLAKDQELVIKVNDWLVFNVQWAICQLLYLQDENN